MRNRAKCRECGDIIESKHAYDCVSCRCGEISVDGGNEFFHANFKNRDAFIIIDDEGNEIIPRYANPPEVLDKIEGISSKPKKEELLEMLDEIVRRTQELPQHAVSAPVTHADFASLAMLLSAILRSD